MHPFYINIFIFLCLLHISNSGVHRQEDGCIRRYTMVCFTYHTLPTRLLVMMHVKHNITAHTTVILKMKPTLSVPNNPSGGPTVTDRRMARFARFGRGHHRTKIAAVSLPQECSEGGLRIRTRAVYQPLRRG
jgi:hypothetical protein